MEQPIGSVGRSLHLLRAVAAVLRADRRLAVIAGGLATVQVVLMAACFVAGFRWLPGGELSHGPIVMLVTAWPLAFVTTFLGVVLVLVADAAFDGRTLPFGAAVRMALRRTPQILAWSLLSAGVGALLRLLTERLPGGFLAELLLGTAWGCATLFAVPVLALDPAPAPRRVLERSAATFRACWPESTVGGLAIGTALLVVVLPALGIGMVAFVWGLAAGFSAGVVAVLAPCVLAVAASLAGLFVATGLFTLALYRAGTLGHELAGPFAYADLGAAVKTRPR